MKEANRAAAILGIGLALTPWVGAQAPAGQPGPKTVAVVACPDRQPPKDAPDTVTQFVDICEAIAAGLAAIAACIAVVFYREQARAATQEHRNNVHQLVFERLDSSEIRAARHFVYSIDTALNNGKLEDLPPLNKDNFAFQKEHWMLLGSPGFALGTPAERTLWQEHKDNAERVARALDQLGYLVREGIVPLNVVARFYTYPTLKCWYKLSPYVRAIRETREQFGHMWEWENLVWKIIKGARDGKGIWEGTLDHDNLKDYADKIEVRTRLKSGFPWDVNWKPPDRSKAD
jgi:hypothetical protein